MFGVDVWMDAPYGYFQVTVCGVRLPKQTIRLVYFDTAEVRQAAAKVETFWHDMIAEHGENKVKIMLEGMI